MKKFTEKLKEYIERYMDWLHALPDGLGVFLFFFSILLPIFVAAAICSNIIGARAKGECLDSHFARRYKAPLVCEEYYNGEWIKIDPEEQVTFFYNGPASRIAE